MEKHVLGPTLLGRLQDRGTDIEKAWSGQAVPKHAFPISVLLSWNGPEPSSGALEASDGPGGLQDRRTKVEKACSGTALLEHAFSISVPRSWSLPRTAVQEHAFSFLLRKHVPGLLSWTMLFMIFEFFL